MISIYNTYSRAFSAASAPPPPPSTPAQQESHVSATAGTYLEEMYEAWARDPSSVHASWDAYFRGAQYQAPPGVGMTKANEGKKFLTF